MMTRPAKLSESFMAKVAFALPTSRNVPAVSPVPFKAVSLLPDPTVMSSVTKTIVFFEIANSPLPDSNETVGKVVSALSCRVPPMVAPF